MSAQNLVELDLKLRALRNDLRGLEAKRRNRWLLCFGLVLITCWSIAIETLLPPHLATALGLALTLPLVILVGGVSIWTACLTPDINGDITRAYNDLRKLETNQL